MINSFLSYFATVLRNNISHHLLLTKGTWEDQ